LFVRATPGLAPILTSSQLYIGVAAAAAIPHVFALRCGGPTNAPFCDQTGRPRRPRRQAATVRPSTCGRSRGTTTTRVMTSRRS
jgi:hypothetical protein